ncbi:HNH endonuclease [Acinetobacter sp. WU_MDCI_Abxb74]|uniref:HNH endonuclease n=1 Tax=Acinetobacter sp. WU_MDCI_Abxb74 TaxID=2850072 RepID=UPI0021CDCC67|nr:HNH endonuclease [Acinetobacter sp. WU_MDCI_Abxb74]MCU4423200.1 HNH endonuclease [Acinetobacter sp. WU_MDCI_Abxb74]
MTQKFFWVNHKQSYKDEISGSYVWSPKREVNGAFNQTYENLTYVQPGDIVFSFAFGVIQAVGYATSSCYEASNPYVNAANWSGIGWKVDINFSYCSQKFRAKDCFEEFRNLLPLKNSPINILGNGNQKCYLAEISIELAKYLIDQVEPNYKRFYPIKEAISIQETSKTVLIMQRIGQSLFRKKLLDFYKQTCPVTGIQLPILLRASHIKPWSLSSSLERLDPANGILLAAHIDALFDNGLISFEDTGEILFASNEVLDIFTTQNIPQKKISLTVGSEIYLKWHRENLFKKI